jgi:hypothetical protein
MHYYLLAQSLELMSSTLERDLYSLGEPGFSIEEVEIPNPDPLATVRYSCVYWIDHLYDSKPKSWVDGGSDLKVTGAVEEFVRKKYLYWLEGLSLCRGVERGVVSITKLWSLVQVRRSESACLYSVI